MRWQVVSDRSEPTTTTTTTRASTSTPSQRLPGRLAQSMHRTLPDDTATCLQRLCQGMPEAVPQRPSARTSFSTEPTISTRPTAVATATPRPRMASSVKGCCCHGSRHQLGQHSGRPRGGSMGPKGQDVVCVCGGGQTRCVSRSFCMKYLTPLFNVCVRNFAQLATVQTAAIKCTLCCSNFYFNFLVVVRFQFSGGRVDV